MLRVLTLILLFVGTASPALPASVNPFASLDQPSQTVTVSRDGVSLIAFYAKRGAVLDLTILVTDQDGEAIRTRIGMRDRQHHTLVLPSADDASDATQVEFMRTGARIEMVLGDRPRGLEFSEYKGAARF